MGYPISGQPIGLPFSSRIVEVLDRETVVVEDSFEQAGIDLEAQDGDYKGTNPRKPLTFFKFLII